MYFEREIQESPWLLAWPQVRAKEFYFFLDYHVQIFFNPFLQLFSHQGGTICCGRWGQMSICLSVSKMVFFRESEVLLWLYISWAEAFVCLNHHPFFDLLDKSDSSALMWEDIMVDGAETVLRFQGFAKCSNASFQCEWNVPLYWFPFWPGVNFRVR